MLKVKFNLIENRSEYTTVRDLDGLKELTETLFGTEQELFIPKPNGQYVIINPLHVITIKAMPADYNAELDA